MSQLTSKECNTSCQWQQHGIRAALAMAALIAPVLLFRAWDSYESSSMFWSLPTIMLKGAGVQITPQATQMDGTQTANLLPVQAIQVPSPHPTSLSLSAPGESDNATRSASQPPINATVAMGNKTSDSNVPSLHFKDSAQETPHMEVTPTPVITNADERDKLDVTHQDNPANSANTGGLVHAFTSTELNSTKGEAKVNMTERVAKGDFTKAIAGKFNLSNAAMCSSSPNKGSRWVLSKLEHELYDAKKAIASAPFALDAPYSDQLNASIYHNASQFFKSYELMEKMFQVYVYKEGEKPLVHTGPRTGIYSSEGLFIQQMEQEEHFATENPQHAHAFYLPYSVTNMVTNLYVPNSHTMLPLATFIKEYVELIAAKHPFWNRTEGGDHFFVACHDWGPATARDHAQLRGNAIKVVCNADTSEEFVEGRDASLPEFNTHPGELPADEDGGGEAGEGEGRAALAFFAGQMHGRVRPELLRHWEYPKGGEEMQIYGVLTRAQVRARSYAKRMRGSRYCVCAMGYEVNSPRVVEAIQAGCVPVLLADGFVLPFSDVLDWSTFSVLLREADVASLRDILRSIPAPRYRAMQRRLRHVRRHFLWHLPRPRPFDTFHMILHSVWTARLAQLPPRAPQE